MGIGMVFESLMLICFGLSWPLSVYKSWKSKTAKGKSLVFEIFISVGYMCGIVGKIVTNTITYVFVFYLINLIMVMVDIGFYIHNRKLDKLNSPDA